MQQFRSLLMSIMQAGSDRLRCESTALFMVDPKTDELWTVVIQGSEIAEIRMPRDKGIVGACLSSGKPINIANVNEDPRFYGGVDARKIGNKTKMLLAVPVFDQQGKVIGVVESINKENGEPFDDNDTETLARYAAEVSDVLAQTGKLRPLFSGIVVVSAVALLAYVIHALLPGAWAKSIGAVLVAVLLGLTLRNSLNLPVRLEPGIQFALHSILRFSIVLLGARVMFGDVLTVGGKALGLIVILMIAAFGVAHLLARVFKMPMRLATLLGVAGAICGNSAIAATAPAIKAKEEQLSIAIAINTLLGTTVMFLYPWLGPQIGMDDLFYGQWVGVAVNDTAQVIAASFSVSPAAGEVATIVKLTRNALLGLVVVVLGLAYARWARDQISGKAVPLTKRLKQSVPLFLLGFLAMALLNTFGFFSSVSAVVGYDVQNIIKTVGDVLLVGALAAVGLGTRLSSLRAAGIAPVVIGVSVSATIGVLGYLMIRYVGFAV
jgi:uncharacterized integral membrane protein (TIGR00698 family)